MRSVSTPAEVTQSSLTLCPAISFARCFESMAISAPDAVYGTEADEGRRRAEARRRVTEVLSFQDLQGPLVLPGVYLASG